MSYENKDSYHNRGYDHDHMIIRILNNASKFKRNVGHLHLYVPASHAELVKKAKTIAHKRGESLSRLILEFLENYVRMHDPTNPQKPLEKFLEQESEEPKVKCAFCKKKAVDQALYLPTGRLYRLCPQHLEKVRNHPKWEVPQKGLITEK